jgi:Fe2+ transport system protein B
MPSPVTAPSTVVLAGLENAGKSALFRGLTGAATGDEANFRGSTVVCRRGRLAEGDCTVVDTPGLRVRSDSESTRAALAQIATSDIVLLVVRGTHAAQELDTLLAELHLRDQRAALAVTFDDKAPVEIHALAAHYRDTLRVPVVVLNARDLAPTSRTALLAAIRAAAPLAQPATHAPAAPRPIAPEIRPARTPYEQPRLGPWLALASLAALFAAPVWLAFIFAEWAQPRVDAAAITPLKTALANLPALPQALLTGSYGVLTLGWYSFLWAFPVVTLIGASVALGEETGLKDRISAALDPWLRRIGLSGRDLIPVLTGFGCNVVAVFQSRGCSRCTRRACVSLIAFGSACSYQIGASLSLFGAAGHGWLFAPYLAALFFVGALHTRLWHGTLSPAAAEPLHARAFLQWPRARALGWRLRAVLGQFLTQAMPIFLGLCVVAALLEYFGLVARLAAFAAPAFHLLDLPGEVAPGVLFSILRKDGLLVLNQGDGTLLAALTAGQVFILVWLASTLTACLVTLWAVRGELGWRAAAALAARQAGTAILTTVLFACVVHVA